MVKWLLVQVQIPVVRSVLLLFCCLQGSSSLTVHSIYYTNTSLITGYYVSKDVAKKYKRGNKKENKCVNFFSVHIHFVMQTVLHNTQYSQAWHIGIYAVQCSSYGMRMVLTHFVLVFSGEEAKRCFSNIIIMSLLKSDKILPRLYLQEIANYNGDCLKFLLLNF